jgi:hypothetical protein
MGFAKTARKKRGATFAQPKEALANEKVYLSFLCQFVKEV